jgi:VWFA-related protein
MENDCVPDIRCHSGNAHGRMLVLLLMLMETVLFPQDRDANSSVVEKRAVFKVQASAVAVKVDVTDKDGNSVTDLTANDFKVYEDNKLQSIQTFELETTNQPEAAGEKEPDSPSKSGIAGKNAMLPRMISIVIDDLTMESVKEFPRIVDAAKEFVNANLSSGVQVAILSGSRKVQFPFSDNRQRLLEELESIPTKLNWETPFHFCPVITDLEAFNASTTTRHSLYYCKLVYKCAGKEPPEPCALITHGNMESGNDFLSKEEEMLYGYAVQGKADAEFRTRNLLYTILQHIRTLRHFEGTKSLVIFSDGFISQASTKVAYQMQDLVNMALRSDIVLNTVSTRGITTYEMGDVTDAKNQWMISMREDDKQAQHSPLAQLASETGGLFFQDNSLLKPIQKIASRQSSYYFLTYSMPPHKPDGAYHSIKISTTRPGLNLSYRKGYYVPKEELTYENTKREDIMEALKAPGNMNEIPMALSYNYFQEDDATYVTSFVSRVNMGVIRFPKEEDRLKNQVSLVLAAFDENDRFINGLEKVIDFQLMDGSYAGLRDRGLSSKVELKLPPGRYKIKAVVREGNQGKMGSITKIVEIP